MATTTKIRVKQVTAADPELTVTLESTDNGTFPAYVKVDASVTDDRGNGPYPGSGVGQGGGLQVVVVVPFTDSKYPTEVTLNYSLTVFFSSDNVHWAQVPAADVTDADGSVPATHNPAAKVATEDTTKTEGSGAGNKGCMGVLFGLLPF